MDIFKNFLGKPHKPKLDAKENYILEIWAKSVQLFSSYELDEQTKSDGYTQFSTLSRRLGQVKCSQCNP